MENDTTFSHWPESLRLTRGLLNGGRVKLARESRGIHRHLLARRLGMHARDLAQREAEWCFWIQHEVDMLAAILDYPRAFFVQDDPPTFGRVFMHGHDDEGNGWCEMFKPEKRT